MSEPKTWDVSMRGNRGTLQITVPIAVARALVAKGYDRAVLSLTEEGLLYKPYASEHQRRTSRSDSVELPFG